MLLHLQEAFLIIQILEETINKDLNQILNTNYIYNHNQIDFLWRLVNLIVLFFIFPLFQLWLCYEEVIKYES